MCQAYCPRIVIGHTDVIIPVFITLAISGGPNPATFSDYQIIFQIIIRPPKIGSQCYTGVVALFQSTGNIIVRLTAVWKVWDIIRIHIRRPTTDRSQNQRLKIPNLSKMACRLKPFAITCKHVRRSPLQNKKRVRTTLKNYKAGKSIGFTARSSLKSMGLIPRSNGCYTLGNKYRNSGN